MTADTRVGTEQTISPQDWCALGEEGKRDWLLQHGVGTALSELGINSPYTVRNEYATGNSIHPVWRCRAGDDGSCSVSLLGSVPSFTKGGNEYLGATHLIGLEKPILVANTPSGSVQLQIPDSFEDNFVAFEKTAIGILNFTMLEPYVSYLSVRRPLDKAMRLFSGTEAQYILFATQNGTIIVRDRGESAITPSMGRNPVRYGDKYITFEEYSAAMGEKGIYIPYISQLNDALRAWDTEKPARKK